MFCFCSQFIKLLKPFGLIFHMPYGMEYCSFSHSSIQNRQYSYQRVFRINTFPDILTTIGGKSITKFGIGIFGSGCDWYFVQYLPKFRPIFHLTKRPVVFFIPVIYEVCVDRFQREALYRFSVYTDLKYFAIVHTGIRRTAISYAAFQTVGKHFLFQVFTHTTPGAPYFSHFITMFSSLYRSMILS